MLSSWLIGIWLTVSPTISNVRAETLGPPSGIKHPERRERFGPPSKKRGRKKAVVGPQQLESQAADPSTVDSMGTDIKRFGEELAERIDRIVKRKAFFLWGDPWTIQGIPIIFPSTTNGFHLGLLAQMTNIRRQDPHKIQLEGQVLASDLGRYKHSFKIDYPHALDGKFRLISRVAYNRDISFRYFGIGNETTIDPRGLQADAALYENTRTGPSFTLSLFRNIGKHFRTGPSVTLKWTDISFPPGSLLEAQRPLGIDGGRTHTLGWGFIYDTLDFEPYPSVGSWYELFFNFYGPYTASDYRFFRSTFTYKRFIPLHPKLVLAHRTMFEALSGDVPFYELGSIGGSDPTIGFGGDKFYHGFESNRFIDKIRTAFGFELRWDPVAFTFAKQDIIIGFVPFLDVGRVWSSFSPFEIGKLHASMGYGTRIVWNKRLIIRTDFAMNEDGTSLFLELGSAF